jgi:hypothetical protein
MGREKRNRRPGAGQRAMPATRGRLVPLWEREGETLGVPAQQTNGGDQPPSAATRQNNAALTGEVDQIADDPKDCWYRCRGV